MLYEIFHNIVKLYPDKLAINDICYKDLLSLVNSNKYNPVSIHNDYRVLIDILTAAKYNKPIVIPPKDGKDYNVPEELPSTFHVILYTSGSTSGYRKPVFINEQMLIVNAFNSINAQYLTFNDIIYNVFSMNHTGAINGQVLPGLLVGASIIIEDFNAFQFFKRLNETSATITHLTPRMLKVIRKVEPTSLRFITAGSDYFKREYIEEWVKAGIPFMINYGMSEAGPITINHVFNSVEELDIFDHGIPLGNQVYCDYKIEAGELLLRGSIVVTGNEWLHTGDCVEMYNDWIMFFGRKSANCRLIEKRY